MSRPEPAPVPPPSLRGPQLLTILTIPLELAHHTLAFCDPRDVASFSQTCQSAYDLVQDEYFWRQQWHAYPFDDPQLVASCRQAAGLPTTEGMDPSPDGWKKEFIRRLKAESVARKKREQYAVLSSRDKKEALQVFISVLGEALPVSSGNGGGLQEELGDVLLSRNTQWLQQVLFGSRLIAPVLLGQGDEGEISELQAHLRSCMDEYGWNGRTRRATSERRNKSRAFVYDLRKYSHKNDYGPYHSDGKVNWVHVEHLVNVVLSNLQDLPAHMMVQPACPPSGLEYLRPYSAPGSYCQRDWAGVEGTWRRYVCFMDYRDLFAFNVLNNQRSSEDGPLHPKFFEDPQFREATRLIEIKLHIVPQCEIQFFPSSDIQPSASPKHPATFFHGTSRGNNGNEAMVEGYVRVACDGTVRWKLVSIYDHSPQWSSHGVQIGDIGSARGIIGVWTTTTHEQGDPVGPFWFWKAKDDCTKDLDKYTRML